MVQYRPLTVEEVPKEHRDSVLFETQFQQSYTYGKRTKMRAMVHVTCPVCLEENSVPVNDIRNFIKGIRAKFPGTHRGCKYPGRIITGEGYVHIWKPEHPNAYSKRYVPEHMLVMSEVLGRPIDTKSESVHHINGDKTDNKIENLQLRKRFHGKGQKWSCVDCGSHNIVPEEL